jgi:hypothetical protein
MVPSSPMDFSQLSNVELCDPDLPYKRYASMGISVDPAHRNLDGSDYHLMNAVDDAISAEMKRRGLTL